MYFKLSDTTRNIVLSFIELIKNIGSGPWVDEFEIECDLCQKSRKYVNIK